MATTQSGEASRLERILALMVASTVGLSLLCFLVVIAAGPLNFSLKSDLGTVVLALPLVGLPLGFVLLITLLIVNMVRRKRDTAAGSH
jgi:hypothetical protein